MRAMSIEAENPTTQAPGAGDSGHGLGAQWPAHSAVDEQGHLVVGGCDLVELAREFGTPAYVYAEDDMRDRAREYLRAFAEYGGDTEVLFASKAFPATAAYRLFREEGLSVDVASAGELHMALGTGFDPERIHMHGNAKGADELRAAFEAGVGTIVLDSLDEIELAESLLDRPQRALIRLTPGVHGDTHAYISTGEEDAKFGLGIADGVAAEAVERLRRCEHLDLIGLHAHIGSQLFELDPFERAAQAVAEFARSVDFQPEVVNLGGGLAIAYLDGQEPPSIDAYAKAKCAAARDAFGDGPRIAVEPGRSLVGNAGVTLYEVVSVKGAGERTYVAVDGGMSDNLRPMLYDARYTARLADRADQAGEASVTVAGKHCESGDVLIEEVTLPSPERGDLLVTPATGAYGHAMANNYNGVPRPPVIFCSGGEAREVVRRETVEDLTARDA